MIIFARNSNSIYPIPYPRSSLNFMGIASTKKKLGFLRRFFGLKKRHFPIHLLYKLRVCINRDFSSVYWLLSEKLTIMLLKAHVSRTNFLSGIHFWSQNCCIYYRSQAIKQYVAQGGKMPTSVKCNPHFEPCHKDKSVPPKRWWLFLKILLFQLSEFLTVHHWSQLRLISSKWK